VRGIVERVCARPDVLEACRKRDLGVVIEILGTHGLTQGRMAGLTGISQGRLSEYKNRKYTPEKSSIFEDFADGIGMPPAARQALGLAPSQRSTAGSRGQPDSAPTEIGRAYPDSPQGAIEGLTRLWRADLDNSPLLDARLHLRAWNDASLRWLVDPGHHLDSDSPRAVRIGMPDVE